MSDWRRDDKYIGGLEKENLDLNARIAELEAENERLLDKLNTVEAIDADSIRQSNDCLRAELAALREVDDDNVKQLMTIKGKWADAEAEVAALKAENERLKEQMEEADEDVGILNDMVIKADAAAQIAYADANKAETHAADCKRLVTACENDIDAERMKRREVEAENERLRVCGNCKWFRAEEYQECGHPDVPYENYYISAPDKCDFTPSRWAERGTE